MYNAKTETGNASNLDTNRYLVNKVSLRISNVIEWTANNLGGILIWWLNACTAKVLSHYFIQLKIVNDNKNSSHKLEAKFSLEPILWLLAAYINDPDRFIVK